jgi:hypothetical protein
VGTRAEIVAPPTGGTSGTTTSTLPNDTSGTSTLQGGPPATTGNGGTISPPRDFGRAGYIEDPDGDAGIGGRPFADATAIEIASDDEVARVTVTMAGAIPGQLAEGETAGVGVDMFAPGNTNPRRSDSQVFAAGNPDGWFAFLAIGTEEPIALPGSFRIEGASLVFELTWSELRAPDQGTFSAFVDYARQGEPLDTATQDRAPMLGTAEYARS